MGDHGSVLAVFDLCIAMLIDRAKFSCQSLGLPDGLLFFRKGFEEKGRAL